MITARVPVALRPVLTPADQAPTSAGWLSVTSRSGTSHYCKVCGGEYLKTLRESAEVPPPTIRHFADDAPPDFGA